jgi:hypothetical protein
LIDTPTKNCTGCHQDLPYKQFSRHHNTLDGFRPKCRLCRTEESRQYFAQNPHKRREHYRVLANRLGPLAQRPKKLFERYRLEVSRYEEMLIAQNGLCAICEMPPDNNRHLQVDHCHYTGKIRGLLCMKCNKGIGQLDDDPSLVAAALRYLLGAE